MVDDRLKLVGDMLIILFHNCWEAFLVLVNDSFGLQEEWKESLLFVS